MFRSKVLTHAELDSQMGGGWHSPSGGSKESPITPTLFDGGDAGGYKTEDELPRGTDVAPVVGGCLETTAGQGNVTQPTVGPVVGAVPAGTKVPEEKDAQEASANNDNPPVRGAAMEDNDTEDVDGKHGEKASTESPASEDASTQDSPSEVPPTVGRKNEAAVEDRPGGGGGHKEPAKHTGPPQKFFTNEGEEESRNKEKKKRRDNKSKKGVETMTRNARKEAIGPSTARSFSGKLAKEDGETADKYELPKRNHDAESAWKIVGLRYLRNKPEVWAVETKEDKAYYIPVASIWGSKEDKEMFGHQWRDFWIKHGLPDLTYVGKSDPNGAKEWNSRENASPRKRTAGRKNQSKKAKRHKNNKTNKKGSSAASGKGVVGRAGSKVLVLDDNKDGTVDDAEASNSAALDKPSGGVGDHSGDGVGGRDSEGSLGVGNSIAKGKGGGCAATTGSGRSAKEGEDDGGVKNRRTQGVVIGPTSFCMKKAGDGHGCKHCGIMDMMGITRNELAFYCAEGSS